jgi:3-methyladenine DNA glycosylase AlkD
MLSREYDTLRLSEVRRLLSSEWHEARLLALLILVRQYRDGGAAERDRIFRFYLRNSRRINNWDLVDSSAPYICGPHLLTTERATLLALARSSNLWERRIAVLATFHGIGQRNFSPGLRVARILLDDPHDLIHKAVGWMLREIGKRDQEAEERFLRAYAHRMPRTMLRYAIERFPEPLRQRYLRGER